MNGARKTVIIISLIMSPIVIILIVFLLRVFVIRKVVIDEYSPDNKYHIVISEIGQSKWPFGESNCQIKLKNGNRTISDIEVRLDTDGGAAEREFFKLICDYFYGEQQLKNVIIEQLGDSSEIVVDSFNRTITIEFNFTKEKGSISNYAEADAGKIHIFGMNGLSSIYHGLIHVVFGSSQYAWISEGNATYWPTYIDEEYYSLNSLSRYYQLLGKNIDNIYEKAIEEAKIKDRSALEAEYQLVHSWNDIYSNKLNIPETKDEFNYKTFTEAVGAACILNHDMLTKINESELLTKTVTHKSIEDYNYKNDPDGLNYYEAFLLFNFLKETYGMNTLFDYYNATISFEEAFGASYQELFPSFYNWVEDIYQ